MANLRVQFSSRFFSLRERLSPSHFYKSLFFYERTIKKKKMSTSPDAPFSSPTLGEQNQNNISASTVVDTYVSTTLKQPTFPELEGVPDLKKHQETSKETANMWRDVTRRSLYQSNYDLIAFNNAFSSYYDPLVLCVSQFDDKDKKKADEAKKNFVTGLQLLVSMIEANQAACEASLGELRTFQKRLDKDQSNLKSDDAAANAQYVADGGRLDELKDLIKVDKKAMEKDMAIIASGATADVIGGVMIAVGVLGEIETAGASTALVVTGLAVVGGGSTAVGLAAKDYDEKSKDLARCTKEVQKINSEIAALHDLVTNLDCLINQANAAIDATEAMGKAWGSLGTQFNTVIEDFTRAETTEIPSMFVLANLNAGKEDWDDVAKTAHAIQDSLINLTIDTSAYDRGVLPSATGTPSVTHLTMMQQTVNASVCATGPISSSGDHAQKIADNVNELNSSSMTLDEQTKISVEAIESVAPTEVVGPLRELKKVIGTIAVSRTALTNDLKQLAPLSLEVRQLTVNPVDVKKSREVFAEVSKVLSGIAGGSMKITDNSLRQASSLAMAIDSRVVSWRDDLAKGAKCDKPEIGQLQKDMKSIERKKKDLKKDFWYCVLGAITSTAASTAYVADISKDQDKIDRKSKALSKDNKEYQIAVSIQKLINQLGISADQTAAQSNASLISARALSSELNSISSYPDHLVEAYVQGQAASLATSLTQLGRVSSPASSPMVAPMGLVSIGSFASDQPEEPLLLPLLGTYWESMQLVTQAAGVVRAQPTISFNLPASATLLQDQLLAVAHSQDWSFETFYSCLQVLQDFVSTSNLMKSVLPVALKSVREKNPEYSTQALEIILTKLKQQQVNETNLLTSLKNGFGRDAANDATSFQAASMVMEKLFEGDNGELAQMEAQLNDLRCTMEKNNQQIAKGASETVIKLVGTEALCVGLVFGLGAIAIPAATAESGEISVLVSKAAKASISTGSKQAKKTATSTFTKTVTSGDPNFMENADNTIEEYGNTLKSLTGALSDASVVYALVSNVSDVNDGTVSLQQSLDKITKELTKQSRVCSVLMTVLENNPTDEEWKEAEEKIEKALDLWSDIGGVCSSFMTGIVEGLNA